MAPPSPLLRDYRPVRACQSRAMPCDTVPAYPILGKWPLFRGPGLDTKTKIFCSMGCEWTRRLIIIIGGLDMAIPGSHGRDNDKYLLWWYA